MSASFKKRWHPTQVLALGFVLVDLLGAFLLSLPFASNGSPPAFIDALFTSTSAVCVTGLTVVNTGLHFSLFGQLVILSLIQIGGLGFMTIAALLFAAIGKHISLRERMVLQESLNTDSLKGLSNMVVSAVAVTFIIEFLGASLLTLRMIPEYGIGRGIYYSIFLSISAFCNAGFDPLGMDCSLVAYQTDPLVNLVLIALIVLGGIGFAIIHDLVIYRRKAFSLHTRVVLATTAVLLALGTILILITEWNNPETIGNPSLSVGNKIMVAAFQSVTLRTAGFDTIGQGALSSAGLFVGMILMFIGASPASTGGGIKTTTFFVALISAWSVIRQKDDYNIGKRRLPVQLVRKAHTIILLALSVVLTDVLLISIIEAQSGAPLPLHDILFEVISACATVGLSTGITALLSPVSKLILICTMFLGRVGLLTVTVALSASPTKTNALRYPEERIIVG